MPRSRPSTNVLRPWATLGRVPLLIAAFVALFAGIAAGLSRLGWSTPVWGAELADRHGALMASGFFGTLIALERAVALGRPWSYTGPALAALATMVLVLGGDSALAAILSLGAAATLMAGSTQLLHGHGALHTWILVSGAGCWVCASAAWLGGRPLLEIVPWWTGFLVLTVAGERLELSRVLMPPTWARRVFVTLSIAILGALVLQHLRPWPASLLLAAALTGLALWLARFDIARRTVRETGLPRFIGACLLSGYVWLGVGGVAGVVGGGMYTGALYDTTLHAIFLGFVFFMVFGHAPIVFPALTGLPIQYHPLFYLHPLLLHGSLGLRLVAELDTMGWLRPTAGLLNAVSIALFIANTVLGAWRGYRSARHPGRWGA